MLRALNGYPTYSYVFRNKVLLLDFFETTCGDCQYEAPYLHDLREQYSQEGFEIIGISKDNLPPNQIAYNASQMGINYPLLVNDTQVEASFGGPSPPRQSKKITRTPWQCKSVVPGRSIG